MIKYYVELEYIPKVNAAHNVVKIVQKWSVLYLNVNSDIEFTDQKANAARNVEKVVQCRCRYPLCVATLKGR